jgi:PAS domain S-box-containing protein
MRRQSLFDTLRHCFDGLAARSGMAASHVPFAESSRGRVSACLPHAPGRRANERQVELFVDSIPAMIWIVDASGKCVYVNKPWLAFTGRQLDQELGDGWVSDIHPDFRLKALANLREALAGQHGFRMEFRVRCGERESRWLLLNGTPRFGENGEFAGMIGAGTDITDQRSAEEDLLDLSGLLIRAQEEERSRIARDLHDDLSQQMALLSTDLEQLAQQAAKSSPEISRRFLKVQRRAQDVFSELHRMSHEIHPSKLDRLGLAAASLSFCREASKQQNLRLECTFQDIPKPLPRDISLCLYRVIQESVRNIVKHSGSDRAEVQMTGSPTEIRLQVSDSGMGFEPDSVGKKWGLGLLSMRERLRLVGGTISIDSQPLGGTRITATIPLCAVRPASPQEESPKGQPA